MVLNVPSRAIIYPAGVISRLEAHVTWVAPAMPAEGLKDIGPILETVEYLFTGWGAPVLDSALLARMPRLRAVFYGAGSIKHMVTEAFWKRDIPVMSAWAANAVPVAEFTFSQILFSLKHGWHYALDAKKRRGRPEPIRPSGNVGAVVGLVSLGMIARLVLGWLKQTQVKVITHDPFLKPEKAAELGVELVDLNTLFRTSDVVSLHTPWLKETEGLITGAHFAQMKPHSTFINTARGAVIKEDELAQVLAGRPDLMALLDVTYPAEPPGAASPLWDLPNVVYTPHIAGSVDRECARMGHTMADELERLVKGEPLKYALSEAQAKVMA